MNFLQTKYLIKNAKSKKQNEDCKSFICIIRLLARNTSKLDESYKKQRKMISKLRKRNGPSKGVY